MPNRRLAANELGAFLGAIAQPRRIQIIEELRGGDKDVGTLASTLELAHSNVSQHLAVLRTLRVVSEHREGRRIVYQLCSPPLAEWLVEGMQFLPAMAREGDQVKNALQNARAAWSLPKNSKRSEG
ncbi:MAG TPA: metalloregulator ArsR/SmtB family transcription factor [Pirellulaceae bacterium]|nr:metalloregulator ArsR/SmtB family transcription factor [Pirellulaceae bacterium]